VLSVDQLAMLDIAVEDSSAEKSMKIEDVVSSFLQASQESEREHRSLAATSLSRRIQGLRSSSFNRMSTYTLICNYYWPFVRQYRGHGVSWTRFRALQQSLRAIAKANDRNSQANYELNDDSDLTDAELRARNGIPTSNPPRRLEQKDAISFPPANRSVRALRASWPSVDWRTKGVVSSVKNQGYCSSCWAFAATALVESKMAQHTGRSPSDLSEEHVKDCTYTSRKQSDLCEGGWPHTALERIANFPARGITTEGQMGYVASANANNCNDPVQASVFPEYSSVVSEWDGTTEAMKEAIQKGPIVGVTWWPTDESVRAFQNYKSGVLTDSDLACANGAKGRGGGGHAMLIVGYDSSTDAFIYKNSWGTSFGDNGYVKIKAGACQSDTHYTTLQPDVKLYGTTYAGCQGKYVKSADKYHGQPVWDRVEPDSSRFIFYCWGRWRITGSQWRDAIVNDKSGNCAGFFVKSEPVPEGTPWYQATWVHNAQNTKVGAVAELRGTTYAGCQGTYVESSDDKVHGKPVWDRVDHNGRPDSSRFIFYCWGRWRITGSQWRDAIVNDRSGNCAGSFLWSDPVSDGTPWYEAKWSHNTQGASAALVL